MYTVFYVLSFVVVAFIIWNIVDAIIRYINCDDIHTIKEEYYKDYLFINELDDTLETRIEFEKFYKDLTEEDLV